MERKTHSPYAPYFRNFIYDGFLPRLFRSFRSSPSVDGEAKWKEVENGLDEQSKSRYVRFNVVLPGRARLDDPEGMDELRDKVHPQPDLEETAKRLLVSQFFFKLKSPVLREEMGFYRCHGSIHCLAVSRSVVKNLVKLLPSRLDFVTDTQVLGSFGGEADICCVCHRYKKEVTFYVRHPSEVVAIYLRSADHKRWEIGGFPQTIQRIEKLSPVDPKFGTSDHGDPGALRCPACRDRTPPLIRKRKCGPDHEGGSKRPHLGSDA